jgi:hypothetical protein
MGHKAICMLSNGAGECFYPRHCIAHGDLFLTAACSVQAASAPPNSSLTPTHVGTARALQVQPSPHGVPGRLKGCAGGLGGPRQCKLLRLLLLHHAGAVEYLWQRSRRAVMHKVSVLMLLTDGCCNYVPDNLAESRVPEHDEGREMHTSSSPASMITTLTPAGCKRVCQGRAVDVTLPHRWLTATDLLTLKELL